MKAIEKHLFPCLIAFSIGFICGISIVSQCSVQGQYCFNEEHRAAERLNRIMNDIRGNLTCPPSNY